MYSTKYIDTHDLLMNMCHLSNYITSSVKGDFQSSHPLQSHSMAFVLDKDFLIMKNAYILNYMVEKAKRKLLVLLFSISIERSQS